jgi:trehalose synthase
VVEAQERLLGHHGVVDEVDIQPLSLGRLAEVLPAERARRLDQAAEATQLLLGDRTVWNVNSTAHGGGVAEMLQTLLAYGRGVGVDTRWLVMRGDPEFFRVTKRLHNRLHGSRGDGGALGEEERRSYLATTRANAGALSERLSAGDIVLLHDPQTAGLTETVLAAGAHPVWRCHVGSDTSNGATDEGWSFLRDLVEPAEAMVFSRAEYAPDWVPREKVRVIPPSLDPFSAKNATMSEDDVATTLRLGSLVDVASSGDSSSFVRRDGSSGRVRRHHDLLEGGPVPADARLVIQVSRWDHLKDMAGVLQGFADHLPDLDEDVHLMLVGPATAGVSDDPEGEAVLEECRELWRRQPAPARTRIHLCCLPMDDVDENAHLVNALQRHATLVVQKSLVEGFGLTVTEPMWKAKPVVASAVGGIRDQIEDGTSGLLLADPTDLDAMMTAVRALLDDPAKAASLGEAAHLRVRDHLLGDRHLVQYADLFRELIQG